MLDAIVLQFLNGLDKGGAYALIALGLTLVFGTLGVVNFAHGALFMLGAFCAVGMQQLLTLSTKVKDESVTFFEAFKEVPYLESWFGDFGRTIIDWSVPLSILLAIPVMLLVGWVMERGLIRFFYKRIHAEQILVTFGLAIVLQEIIKHLVRRQSDPGRRRRRRSPAAPISAPGSGSAAGVVYPWWRLIYFAFSAVDHRASSSASCSSPPTAWWCAPACATARRSACSASTSSGASPSSSASPRSSPGSPGVMYTPIVPPNYRMGMDFLVLSFVVVVVGGMGSLGGAVLAGFLLGILQSFASMNEIKAIFPGIDQIIIYLVAVIVLLVRPRGPARPRRRDGVLSDGPQLGRATT